MKDVSAADELGATPLHRAAAMGHLELAELLVAAGASGLAQDGDGETPLHKAAANVRAPSSPAAWSPGPLALAAHWAVSNGCGLDPASWSAGLRRGGGGAGRGGSDRALPSHHVRTPPL